MTMNSCAFCGEPVEFGCVCDKCQPKHKRTSLWKKFWCWLTGGCVYLATNLQSRYDEKEMVYRFQNRCVKCEKVDEWKVPAENILPKRNPFYVPIDADRCICCGEIIPEGRMVCPNCLVAVKESKDGK